MYVSSGQIYVFIACVSFGGLSGIIFSVFSLIKTFANKKIIRTVLDVLFFVLFSFAFVIYSHILNFPNFRPYMFIGVILGLILYVNSFNIMLAKFNKRLYNIIKRKRIRTNGRAKN